MPLLAIAAASQTIGSFTVIQTPDPMTDKPRAAAAVSVGATTLAINCNMSESKGLRVSISDDEPIKEWVTRGSTLITIRFDKTKPFSQVWDRADTMVFTKKPSTVRQFLAGLSSSTSVVIRLDRPDGSSADKEFGTVGAREAVAVVAGTCGISLPG